MKTYDYIIVGLGTAGSSASMVLAKRGASVMGLDAFSPPHQSGSHHGESRSIRRAYLEGSAYVPMVMRAWEMWHKLEQDTGTLLLTVTPNLTIGPADCPALNGFLSSARTYDIPHETLTAGDVRRRWPCLAVPESFAAGLEIEAGILYPEKAIAAMLSEARKAGAVLKVDEPALGWSVTRGVVRVTTSKGTYECGRMLLAAGARMQGLCGGRLPLTPKRVPVHWIAAPDSEAFRLGKYPVNFWQIPETGRAGEIVYREFYSLPAVGPDGRLKAAPHNNLVDCDPEVPLEPVSDRETGELKRFLEKYIPSLVQADMIAATCLYNMTPDGEFILDWLPDYDCVAIVALAGHGFKFAPVLGEVLADVLQEHTTPFDIDRFSLARFLTPSQS